MGQSYGFSCLKPATYSVRKIKLDKKLYLFGNYLRPQKINILWLVISILAGIALDLINPQIVSSFIDHAVARSPITELTKIAFSFLSAFMILGGCTSSPKKTGNTDTDLVKAAQEKTTGLAPGGSFHCRNNRSG